MGMTKEKFKNIQDSLLAACAAEERKKNGGACGFLLVVVEIEKKDPTQIHTRYATGLPPSVAHQALAQVLSALPKPAEPAVETSPAPAEVAPTSQDESACLPASPPAS